MLKDFVPLPSAFLLLIIPSYAVSQVAPPIAASKDGPVIVTRQTLHHDVSLPLRDLAAQRALAPLPPQEREVDEVKVIPLRPGYKPVSEPDTVLQRTIAQTSAEAASTLGPVAGLNFEGLGSGIPNFNILAAPPDTNGAVGATQYVQWVNVSFAVFDKSSGAMTFGPALGNTLWTGFGGLCETNNDGDPIITYDKLADRWVFTQLVFRNQPFMQCVAVSTTSDATGPYFRYAFQYPALGDYPKVGVWPDAYYITFNMFQGGATFIGADACAYDRKSMLQGLPATQICFQQASTVGSLLPSDLDGHISPPAGSPNYMVDFDVNSLNLYKFHVDFQTPSNSTFTGPVNIPVAAFTPFCPQVRSCVPQPAGDGTMLDSLGDRLMYRLAYRNFGDHESLVVNHSVVADGTIGNSGIRWYEIQNPSGSSPAVAQQSTLAPDSGYRWMGSVAMDASGNLAVGYSVANATSNPPVFPSIAFAARLAFDPPGTLQSETTIVAGSGSQINGLTRWGDYSAMQVDPADDCTFWYTQEYMKANGSFNWNTRIANFKFPGCGATALSMTKSHSGDFTQGQSGATYTLTVTNIGSKPTDGTAVTVADTLPAGLTATAISSTDATWVCTLGTLSCTRSDVLAHGKTYPAITVTVNVAANAAGLVTNTATVTGGGNKDTTDNTASDVTTVIQTGPDPAIAMTNVPLVANQTATYSITVTNRGLTTTTTDPLTVTDTIPAGLTALAAVGTGWGTCTVTAASVSCTRNDPLPSNQSYPPITVCVSVGVSTFTTVVNTASLTGGGDVNPLNNTATDPATVVALPPGLAFTNPAIPLVPSVALEFKPGVQIAITGTATGPSFQDFQLQVAEGINPATGWSSAGITLAGGGSPVTKGPLGTWDTSAITQADFYSIRLTVDDFGFSNSLVTFVYLEPSLISQHWPVLLDGGPLFYAGFQSLADGAGNQRLFVVTPPSFFTQAPPSYVTFSPDGSSKTSILVFQPGQLNPAVGPLDGSPGGDAVVPDKSTTGLDPPQVQLFHSDNSAPAIQLPANVAKTISGFAFDFQVPVLEDMEGTGQLDFVSLAASPSAGFNGIDHAYLLALRPDGSVLSGNFPVVIPDQNSNLILTFKPRVLVGDLHGDGSKEFVVIAGTSSTTFTLLQFAHDGTPVPWAVPQFNATPAAMILADLDHNGALETILTLASALPSGEDDLTMHVFQPDGSERPGFPIDLGQVNPDDFTFSQIVVGDLNRDGTEEIIELHHNGQLHVLEPDGTPFPVFKPPVFSNGAPTGTLALADIDGDGFPEILLGRYEVPTFTPAPGSPARASRDGVDGPESPARPPLAGDGVVAAPIVDSSTSSPASGATVHNVLSPEGTVASTISSVAPQSAAGTFYTIQFLTAVSRDGTIVRNWTLLGINGNEPSATGPTITVGDFNKDGFTDIALNYELVLGGGNNGFLGTGTGMVLTTGTAFNAAVNDWPLVYQNPRNTAVMRRAITLALISPENGESVTATVPITAATTGNVASVQFKLDGANFGTPVTTPPFTISWDTSQAPTGVHQLLALATDSTGRPVASAPVNVTVVRENGSTTMVALTAGTNPANFGKPLTFTATVAPNTATGNVTFFDGPRAMSGAVALSGGSASFTTSSLFFGSHSISATYSGDPNFAGSSSAAISQQISPDFSIGTSPGSATIRAGQSATFTFTVLPLGGFNQTVNFSCSGLPAESQCTFAPASVTPNGGPATSVLTITTTAASAVLGAPPVPKNNLPLVASLSGAMLGMLWIACSPRTRGRVRSRLLLLAGALCLLVSLTSCGGGGGGGGGHHDPGTPPGTSSVTVTATSGSNSHPSTVTLNVN